MTKITRSHKKPYLARVDLESRLNALKEAIEYLRDSQLQSDIKIAMLNHAVWEVTIALGNFKGQFRSRGVKEGDRGTKIQREHVFKRKNIVEDIRYVKNPLEVTLKNIVHCVVTKEEHDNLEKVDPAIDGWQRYAEAGIDVFDFSADPPKLIPLN